MNILKLKRLTCIFSIDITLQLSTNSKTDHFYTNITIYPAKPKHPITKRSQSHWLGMTQHQQTHTCLVIRVLYLNASSTDASSHIQSVAFFNSIEMGCLRIALIFGTLLTAIITYKVHKALFEVPPLPKIEETWWGPGKPGKIDTSIRPFKINISEEVNWVERFLVLVDFCLHLLCYHLLLVTYYLLLKVWTEVISITQLVGDN